LIAVVLLPLTPRCALGDVEDAGEGYARVHRSILKVWVTDRTGRLSAGTAFVIGTKNELGLTYLLTAYHVVENASHVEIERLPKVSGVTAVIAEQDAIRDLAVLKVERTDLVPLAFARDGTVREGSIVASAGYFQNDPNIGRVCECLKLQYPGSVSAILEDGKLLELNLDVEEGLSGSPVFLPSSGTVVGMIDSKLSGGGGSQRARIGYAVSGTAVIERYLRVHGVAFATVGIPAKPTPKAPAESRSQTLPRPTEQPAPRETERPIARDAKIVVIPSEEMGEDAARLLAAELRRRGLEANDFDDAPFETDLRVDIVVDQTAPDDSQCTSILQLSATGSRGELLLDDEAFVGYAKTAEGATDEPKSRSLSAAVARAAARIAMLVRR
jgi:hypothetical protein